MHDIADRYAKVSQAFADRVAGVAGDRWGAHSPCAGWSALDVLRHVVDTAGMFERLVGRELTPGPDPAADPSGAFEVAREQILADLRHPERASAAFDGYFGRTTFAEAIDRFVTFDLVVHGWDLARATGQDERIDPEELPRLWAAIETFGDAMRGESTFGAAIEPAPDADEQTRLLNFLGRRV